MQCTRGRDSVVHIATQSQTMRFSSVIWSTNLFFAVRVLMNKKIETQETIVGAVSRWCSDCELQFIFICSLLKKIPLWGNCVIKRLDRMLICDFFHIWSASVRSTIRSKTWSDLGERLGTSASGPFLWNGEWLWMGGKNAKNVNNFYYLTCESGSNFAIRSKKNKLEHVFY